MLHLLIIPIANFVVFLTYLDVLFVIKQCDMGIEYGF